MRKGEEIEPDDKKMENGTTKILFLKGGEGGRTTIFSKKGR